MNLRTLLFLAWKDLTKDLRVLCLVILAVGSGSITLVPTGGLTRGLILNLFETTIDVAFGHVIIVPKQDRPFLRNVDDVRAAVESLPAAEAVSVRLRDRCVIVRGDKSFAGAALGVDPIAESRATTIRDKVLSGRFLDAGAENEIVVGKEIADKLQIKTDEDVEVVFSNGTRQWLRVVGITAAGMQQLDGQVMLRLRRLQSVLQLEERASEMIVRLTDMGLADNYRLRLERMGLEARIETWRDRMEFVERFRQNFGFFQKFLTFLTLVAAGITTGVLIYTNIQHKRRSIGILKAIGAKDRGVLTLFLLEGLALGLAGASVGNLIGGGVGYYLSVHPVGVKMTVVSWPLRAALAPELFVFPTILTVATTIAAACYPAWRASRLGIVDAIWAT